MVRRTQRGCIDKCPISKYKVWDIVTLLVRWPSKYSETFKTLLKFHNTVQISVHKLSKPWGPNSVEFIFYLNFVPFLLLCNWKLSNNRISDFRRLSKLFSGTSYCTNFMWGFFFFHLLLEVYQVPLRVIVIHPGFYFQISLWFFETLTGNATTYTLPLLKDQFRKVLGCLI